jgi:predicted acetyltransferase
VISEGFDFGRGLEEGTQSSTYLERLADLRVGTSLPPALVTATFLVAEVAGCIVGRISIRHTPTTSSRGWAHIGYACSPSTGAAATRPKSSGRASSSPGLSGWDGCITCDDDNVGSAAVIHANGGLLDNVVETEPGKTPKRRYWID